MRPILAPLSWREWCSFRAIYPMPAQPVATVLGHTINLYDILPVTHAAEALRRIMIYV